MLSDGTIHGDIWRTGVDRRDLASTYILRPLTITFVPDFGVMEITEVFRSTPEKTEKTRGS